MPYEGRAYVSGGDWIYEPNLETDPERILEAAKVAKRHTDPSNQMSYSVVRLPGLGEVTFNLDSTLESVKKQGQDAEDRRRVENQLLPILYKLDPDKRAELLKFAKELAGSQGQD